MRTGVEARNTTIACLQCSILPALKSVTGNGLLDFESDERISVHAGRWVGEELGVRLGCNGVREVNRVLYG